MEFIDQHDLKDVVLVAHSYAGMLVPGIAAAAEDRLARLVFLDAFVPDEGDRCFDLMPAEARQSIHQQARTEGDGWRFPPFPLEMLGVRTDEDCPVVAPRLEPQPLKTYEEPLRGTRGGVEAGATHLHLVHRERIQGCFRAVRSGGPDSARLAVPGVELAAGHQSMVTAPEALAEALLQDLAMPDDQQGLAAAQSRSN